MPSLAVTGDAITGYVVTYTVNEAHVIASADRVTVTRIDQSGHYPDTVIRDAELHTLTAYDTAFHDYEAPFETTFTYSASRYSSSDDTTIIHTATATGTATSIPTGFAMIHKVLDPRIRIAPAMQDFSSSRDTNILGKHQVLERRNPVILTDVLTGRKGTIQCNNIHTWTIDFDGRGPYTAYTVRDEYLNNMFDDGGVFQFRSHHSETGQDDMYFIVDSVSDQRLSRVVGALTDMPKQYDIDYTEVDMPDPSLSATPLITWGDVDEVYVNWLSLDLAKDSWSEVMESLED